MGTRAEQREETRRKIMDAALEAFSEFGFQGASTRDIAARAGIKQSLLTYHFKTKDNLWRESVGRFLESAQSSFLQHITLSDIESPRDIQREMIRAYVRTIAERPQFFRIIVDFGKRPDERLDWLVEEYIKPAMEKVVMSGKMVGVIADEVNAAHFAYILIGAGSMIFAVAPVCQRLFGLDPTTPEAIETHANLVAQILVP